MRFIDGRRRLIAVLVLCILAALYGALSHAEQTARGEAAAVAARRAESARAIASARVQLAHARARQVPYDSAGPHLALLRAEQTLLLERGNVVLLAVPFAAPWGVGIDTVVSVDRDTIRTRGGASFVTDSARFGPAAVILRRTIVPGVLVYVR